MTDKELVHNLQELHTIHASSALHEKMHGMVENLPGKHRGFYFPLFAFQTALIGGLVLVLVGVGSGAVVAAKESVIGKPFYPVRQLIQNVVGHVVPQVTPVLHHFSQPTPTKIPQPTNESSHEKNQEENKDVKGAAIHAVSKDQKKENTVRTQEDFPRSTLQLHEDIEVKNDQGLSTNREDTLPETSFSH